MKKIKYITFGCKVNQYETEVLREQLTQKGFCECKTYDTPDYILINSCAVTAEGERKMRQTLRRMKSNFPLAVIVLFGCASQVAPEAFSQLPADIIMGNTDMHKIAETVASFNGEKIINVLPHITGEKYNTPSICGMHGRTRAYMKIQDGCDRFCTYCIIPYSRGRVRSRSIADIKAEARALADAGYSEIVLTGINLTSFGKDTGESFADAIDAAALPEGIKRVRLGSLEPDYISDELLDRMVAQPKFCPQFHLSLQSGNDATLKRMNRHYDFAFYKNLVERIRQRFINSAITTDVMVGFAGETDEDFADSLQNVLSIGFAKVHVFPYSVRPGTRAANFADQLSAKVKESRSREMIAATEKSKEAFLDTQIGNIYPVLFEQGKDDIYEGSTPNYSRVVLKSESDICGKILDIKITGREGDSLMGYIVS